MTLTAFGSRNGGMVRRAFGLAAALTATFGLAQAALASTELAPNTPSTTLAGLDFNGYIGVPGNVSAIIVVPKLNCSGTPTAGSSIYVGVGIGSVNSYARLYLACTPQGVARYYPSLVVNGTIKNISDAAHAGDMIEFAVSQSDSQVTDSVIDLTHKFVVTRTGTGSGTGQGITAGDYPVVSARRRWGAELRHPGLLQRVDQWIPVRRHGHRTPGRRPLRQLDAPDQGHLLGQYHGGVRDRLRALLTA